MPCSSQRFDQVASSPSSAGLSGTTTADRGAVVVDWCGVVWVMEEV